jgi:phage portal protein BeeE
MLGADSGESLTYSNTESIQIEFVTFSLQPWLRVIEAALSNDRDLFARQQFCEFKVDGLLRADAKTRAEVYRMALDPELGWLRRDEVRDFENLPPEPAQGASEATTNGTGDPAAIAVT